MGGIWGSARNGLFTATKPQAWRESGHDIKQSIVIADRTVGTVSK